jgi:hypothetical protein
MTIQRIQQLRNLVRDDDSRHAAIILLVDETKTPGAAESFMKLQIE